MPKSTDTTVLLANLIKRVQESCEIPTALVILVDCNGKYHIETSGASHPKALKILDEARARIEREFLASVN